MLERILPGRIDNAFAGHRLAIWLLIPVLVMKTGIALGVILNGRHAAQSADGIPLDSFGPAGAQAFLAVFAIWGLGQLLFSVLGVLALVRYRSMIPLLFVLLTCEHLARKGILWLMPVERTGTPPGVYINLALLAVMLAGLALSLWRRAPLPA